MIRYIFIKVKDHQELPTKMNNEKKSGITIHYVDNGYDTGKIIFQKEVKISKSDSVEDISNKVHNLELEHFPRVIELILFKVFVSISFGLIFGSLSGIIKS